MAIPKWSCSKYSIKCDSTPDDERSRLNLVIPSLLESTTKKGSPHSYHSERERERGLATLYRLQPGEAYHWTVRLWLTDRTVAGPNRNWGVAQGRHDLFPSSQSLPLQLLSAANHRMDSGGKPSTAHIVVLATSSALTAIFYSIYKSRATVVARLKVWRISGHSLSRGSELWVMRHVLVVDLNCVCPQEAKKVSIDQDLKTILSETPGRCVPYAVIEGASWLAFPTREKIQILNSWISPEQS